MKTWFLGPLTCLTQLSKFRNASFEFFTKNAENGTGDVSKLDRLIVFALPLSFGSRHFGSEKWTKMKYLRKLQNMFLWRAWCSKSAWVILRFVNSSSTIFENVTLCDFKVIFRCNSHAPMLSRLPFRGASHLLLCKGQWGPSILFAGSGKDLITVDPN